MKKIIRGLLLLLIIVTGMMGFLQMNRVGLDGAVDLGPVIVSPMMLIITAVILALILMTNVFAWIAIGAAVILLVLFYAFSVEVIQGQQMMAIYLMIFGIVDIWVSTGDRKK